MRSSDIPGMLEAAARAMLDIVKDNTQEAGARINAAVRLEALLLGDPARLSPEPPPERVALFTSRPISRPPITENVYSHFAMLAGRRFDRIVVEVTADEFLADNLFAVKLRRWIVEGLYPRLSDPTTGKLEIKLRS